MAAQVEKKARRAFQAVLVELGFVGPFRLRAAELVDRKDQRRKTVQLVPISRDENERLLATFEAERRPWIFPVAAFRPVLPRIYDCLIRWRDGAKIIEAVPETAAARKSLESSGIWEWQPKPAPQLEFQKDERGRWSARLSDGLLVIPFKMDDLFATGKVVFAAGELSIRRSCTRTFLIAGPKELMTAVSHERLDALVIRENGNDELPFDPSSALQFRIFGRFVTAFEIFGGVAVDALLKRDADGHFADISNEVEGMLRRGMEWWRKTFTLTLHPDVAPADASEPERQRRGVLFAESTRERDRAAAWLREWAAWAEAEVLAGREPTLPKPFGRQPRVFFKRHAALVELTRDQLVDLFVTNQPAAVPPPVLPQRPKPEPRPASALDSAITAEEMRQAIASRTKAKLEAFERRRQGQAGEKPAARPTRPVVPTTKKPTTAAVNAHGVRKLGGDTVAAQPPTERAVHSEGKGGASVADRLDEATRAKLVAKVKQPLTSLTSVPGVGLETARKLEQSGSIRSAEQLARTSPADIELLVGGKTAEKLIRAAQELINEAAADEAAKSTKEV